MSWPTVKAEAVWLADGPPVLGSLDTLCKSLDRQSVLEYVHKKASQQHAVYYAAHLIRPQSQPIEYQS